MPKVYLMFWLSKIINSYSYEKDISSRGQQINS